MNDSVLRVGVSMAGKVNSVVYALTSSPGRSRCVCVSRERVQECPRPLAPVRTRVTAGGPATCRGAVAGWTPEPFMAPRK